MSVSEQVKEFVAECRNRDWCVEIPQKDDVIRIFKYFQSKDVDQFVKADSEYYNLLSMIPQKYPGSIWGTDGGGVGAFSAIQSGVFKMNKSGVSKRFTKALRKYLIETPDLNII